MVNRFIKGLAAEIKPAQVENDVIYYMTNCAGRRSSFIQNELEKIIKHQDSYSYLFKILRS